MVHNDYGSLSGEEHAVQAIADLLRDHGHEVFWFRRSSAEILGSVARKVKAFFTGIYNPFAAKRLAQELDKVKPDIVQVQNIYPLLSPSIFKPIKERGIPVVMRCPNYKLFCPNGLHLSNDKVCEKCLGFGRELWCILTNCESSLCKSTGYALRNAYARITKRILNGVDTFIVLTEFQKQKFIAAGIPADHIGIVPGLTPTVRIPKEDCLGDLVTFVGRVSPEKGVEDFLSAARLVPDVPFAVAGNDIGMPGVRERSPENVTWLGFLESDSLHKFYLRSRVVVVPSRWYEGFPNVVTQAMAYARPVVAARIGALISIVDDGHTGLHFQPSNPSDLADKLKRLYGNLAMCREMGRNGRIKAVRCYSADRIYQALISTYEQAMRLRFHRASHARI